MNKTGAKILAIYVTLEGLYAGRWVLSSALSGFWPITNYIGVALLVIIAVWLYKVGFSNGTSKTYTQFVLILSVLVLLTLLYPLAILVRNSGFALIPLILIGALPYWYVATSARKILRGANAQP